MYGTVGAFAADILRHEFEKVNIRGDRRCDAIVVDEIDYMTLDQGTQVFFLFGSKSQELTSQDRLCPNFSR